MLTEHSVTYGTPDGAHTVITRVIFTEGSRILGSETTTEKWFEGEWAGWKFIESCTDTREFHRISEAQAWMDEMFRAWEVAQVKKSGGTKLVYA
jgi:hypothetical protein